MKSQYYSDDFRTPQEVRNLFRPLNGYINLGKMERLAKQMFLYGDSPEGLEARNLLQEYKNKAQAIMATAQKACLPLPPIEKVRCNPIRAGTYTQAGRRFFPCCLPVDGMAHMLILSQPGKGKTTLLLNLCEQIENLNESKGHKNRIGMIMVDRSRDYRNCKFEKLVIDMSKLKNFNPFDGPPMVPWTEWLPVVCDLLMSNWKVLRATKDRLIDYLKQYYDSVGKIPTLNDLSALMESDKVRNRASERDAELFSVARDRVKSMMNALPGCSSRRSFPFHEILLAGVNCVIEMNNFDKDTYSFVVGWLLLYCYIMNRFLGVRGNVTTERGGTFFVFDEAYLLWEPGRERQYSRVENGIGFLEGSPLWVRGYRMSMICASQTIPSSELFTSCNIVIAGSVRDFDQANHLARSVGEPDVVSIIPNLERGEWIAKIGDLPVSAIVTEDYPLPDEARIKDEEIDKAMEKVHLYFEEVCKDPEEEKQESDAPKLLLSTDGRKLLFHVWRHPEWSISKRWRDKDLGFTNGNKQRDVVEEVTGAGYAERVEIKIGTRRQVYLVLTEKSIRWLKHAGKPCDHIAILNAEGQGPEHTAYQQLLVSFLRSRKFNVWQNKYIPDNPAIGKLVDVWAESSEKKVAYEIAMNSSVDAYRFRVMAESSIPDEIIFLVRDIEVENGIRRELRGVDLTRTRFVSASNYVADLLAANISYYTDNSDNTDNSSDSTPLGKPNRDSDDNNKNGPDYGPTKPHTRQQGGPNN